MAEVSDKFVIHHSLMSKERAEVSDKFDSETFIIH